MIPFMAGVKSSAMVTPEAAAEAAKGRFWHPGYSAALAGNLLTGIFSGGVGPAAGGLIGSILLHKMQSSGTPNPGAIAGAVQEAIGTSSASSLVFGGILGQLLARSHMGVGKGLEPGNIAQPEQLPEAPKLKPIPKFVPPKDSPQSGIEQAVEPSVTEVS
jgi:hypothetical protein